MKTKTLQLTTILYAWTAGIVGVWRHLHTGDSPQAIAFCVVCGAIALLGGWMLPRFRWPGLGLIALSLLFVGGWFVQRVFTHSEGASLRVTLILIACAIEAFVLSRAVNAPAR